MIELIPFDVDNVIGLRITGKIRGDMFDEVTALLEQTLARHDTLRVHAEMPAFEGRTLTALLKDLELGLQHWKDIEREAVVTDAHWVRTMTAIGDKLFPGIAVRAFPTGARDDARAWMSA